MAVFARTAALLVLLWGHVGAAAETPVDFSAVLDKVVYKPLPEFDLALLAKAWCTIHMVVDPSTGQVTRAYFVERSGDSYLTFKILESVRTWRFKPGTPGLIRVTFGMTRGWHHAGPVQRGEPKRVDDVLAPFLGKGTVVKGEMPAYPPDEPWTNKRGTGVCILHVDSKGAVSDVRIKKASGDPPFDRVTVQTLRQWRFRRGPMTIELPLSFVLTPSTFRLHLPKHRG